MSNSASEIILHNYPQSPVAEKVRVILGIKGLSWSSVEIPRIPPKPMLTKLTGGYRRTPVMQIGADIYCDSQCIIRELERRVPSPTLFPSDNTGLLWCLSRWADGDFFDLVVKIVLGSNRENLPADFAEDRGRLYLGPDWAAGLKEADEKLPHLVSQYRVVLSWLEQQFSDGRNFLLGNDVAAIDALVYYTVWFVRGRWDKGASFLSEFPHLERWETNVRDIGHGTISDMSPEQAIEIAGSSTPIEISRDSKNDPQGLSDWMSVTVSPDVDGGEQPVEGQIVAVDAESITVSRSESDLGTLHVHFPRAGYKITETS